MTRIAAAALVALALLPPPAEAHPHVFVDGGADFVFDEAGRLTAVRLAWRYDAFFSLLILDSVGLDADGDGALDAGDHERLVDAYRQWTPGWEGDMHLRIGGERVLPGDPTVIEGDFSDGRIEMRFLRPLPEPLPATGLAATLRLYDPTYYIAYAARLPVALEGAPQGCRTVTVPFEPTTGLAALQATLSEIPPDQTPEQEGVGALFADRIELACPAD